jgi:site-specific recombinase XerD
MLASAHSRRSYKHAIEKFITGYCSEPRLGFNRSVVVRYRSFLEGLSLSAATINLHLSAIRRLADETAESGWLSADLAIGIRGLNLNKSLASEQQMSEISSGCGTEIAGPGTKTALRDAPRL